MRTLLLASASILLIGGTALAQTSTSATNTSPMNSKTSISPRLPVSADEASADQFLSHAQAALKRGRTGEAQEALERAETRLLSRSTVASQAATPDADPKVASIEAARQALGNGDRATAMTSIQAAMSQSSAQSSASMAPPEGTPTATTTPDTYVGPGPAAGVKPNTLGGIATGVGSPNGTGAGSQARPQASYSGSADVPPGSVAGIATSVGSPNGTGADSQPRPQASFGSGAVPPNSLAGIGSTVGSPGGTGAGSQSRPQASFSGPASVQVVIPPAAAPASP